MMVPDANAILEAVLLFFIALAMSPAFEPHALEDGAVFEDLTEEAVRLTIFELAFFDASVVPAAATDPIFFVGFFVNLTIVIVCTYPLVLHVESLRNKMVVSNVRHSHWWQLFPFLNGAS